MRGLVGGALGGLLGALRRKSPAQLQDEYADAVQVAMIGVMAADGDIADQELGVIASLYHRMTGEEVSPAALRERAAGLGAVGRTAEQALAQLSPHLTRADKDAVLCAALAVANADGAVEAAEKVRVDGIARALGVALDQSKAAPETVD